MNKAIIVIMAFVLGFGSAGCKFINKLRLGAGAGNSKVQDENTIDKWEITNKVFNIGRSRSLGLSPETYLEYFQKYGQGGGVSPLIFTRSGELYFYDGCTNDACIKDLTKFLSELTPEGMHQSASAKPPASFTFTHSSFNEFSRLLYTLSGGKANSGLDTSKDYTLVLPYALYYGNKKQVKELISFIKAVEANKQSKFDFIFLNLDRLAWWGEEWNKKIKIYYN